MCIRRVICLCLSVAFFLNVAGCGTVASNRNQDSVDVKIEKIQDPTDKKIEKSCKEKDGLSWFLNNSHILFIPLGKLYDSHMGLNEDKDCVKQKEKQDDKEKEEKK